VRDVVKKAVQSICDLLGVSAPEKKMKGKDKRNPDTKLPPAGDQPDETDSDDQDSLEDERMIKEQLETSASEREEIARMGSRTAAQEVNQDRKSVDSDSSEDDEEEDEEERAISRMEAALGSSSEDEESESDIEDRGNPMEITSDEEEAEPAEIGKSNPESEDEESESDDDDEEDNRVDDDGENNQDQSVAVSSSFDDDPFYPFSDEEEEAEEEEESASQSPSPKPVTKTKVKVGAESTFLPTLMGGYISGSESASDVEELAPARKNRRGQRARQAIWEKKYKDQAKHLAAQARSRDAGWDARRGAVGSDDKHAGKPWKRGVSNPFKRSDEPRQDRSASIAAKSKPKGTEPLHPSWEAKRKAKEAMQNAVFSGRKTTFD
jgi:hypothetical protein